MAVEDFEIGKAYYIELIEPWKNDYSFNIRIDKLTTTAGLQDFSITENYNMSVSESSLYVPPGTIIVEGVKILDIENKTLDETSWFIPLTLINKNTSEEFILVQKYTSKISESIRNFTTENQKKAFDTAASSEIAKTILTTSSFGNNAELINVENSFTELYMYKSEYQKYDDERNNKLETLNNIEKTLTRQLENERISLQNLKYDMNQHIKVADDAQDSYLLEQNKYIDAYNQLNILITQYNESIQKNTDYFNYLDEYADINDIEPPQSFDEWSNT